MKLVLKMLQNICVVIKTTTACVCLGTKDGAASAASSGLLAQLFIATIRLIARPITIITEMKRIALAAAFLLA